MKKIALRVVLVLVLSLMPIILYSYSVSAADAGQADKLRLTYVKLPLNVPMILVKHFELLEKEFAKDGITVEWYEITSGGKQTQALAAGSIDIASVVSSTAAISARANGMDLKIIAVFARAPRAFNVVAINPEIRNVADLKGKKVAGPKGSLLNQTLFAALLQNGLKPEDVGYVHMPVPKALAALVSRSVDAALIAGPTVPTAEKQGARIIANGEGLVKGLIVTAVGESFLEKHPNLVKRYLQVQRSALSFMQTHPDKTFEIVANETGLSKDEVKHMYAWYDFNPTINSSDMADLTATQAFLVQSGMLAAATDINALVEDMTR
jgi:sulfonate transport system substrate-binding protein